MSTACIFLLLNFLLCGNFILHVCQRSLLSSFLRHCLLLSTVINMVIQNYQTYKLSLRCPKILFMQRHSITLNHFKQSKITPICSLPLFSLELLVFQKLLVSPGVFISLPGAIAAQILGVLITLLRSMQLFEWLACSLHLFYPILPWRLHKRSYLS